MLRRFAVVGLVVIMAFFTGCGLIPSRTQEETLYNGYMGLTVNVPQGWYIETISESNLTKTPEESGTLDDMVADEDYGDGGYYYDLICLQNRNLSSNDNHVVLELFAENYSGVFSDIEEYVDDCEYYYLGDKGNDYHGELVSRDEVLLNGATFVKLMISVEHPDNDVPYIEEYYITQIGDLYLTCYINYWSDNTASRQEAQKSLEEAFELDHSEVGRQGGIASIQA